VDPDPQGFETRGFGSGSGIGSETGLNLKKYHKKVGNLHFGKWDPDPKKIVSDPQHCKILLYGINLCGAILIRTEDLDPVRNRTTMSLQGCSGYPAGKSGIFLYPVSGRIMDTDIRLIKITDVTLIISKFKKNIFEF
jgi:hypothetical protein